MHGGLMGGGLGLMQTIAGGLKGGGALVPQMAGGLEGGGAGKARVFSGGLEGGGLGLTQGHIGGLKGGGIGRTVVLAGGLEGGGRGVEQLLGGGLEGGGRGVEQLLAGGLEGGGRGVEQIPAGGLEAGGRGWHTFGGLEAGGLSVSNLRGGLTGGGSSRSKIRSGGLKGGGSAKWMPIPYSQIQFAAATADGITSVSAALPWSPATRPDTALIIFLVAWGNNGGTYPAVATPAGWTRVNQVSNTYLYSALYTLPNNGGQNQSPTFTANVVTGYSVNLALLGMEVDNYSQSFTSDVTSTTAGSASNMGSAPIAPKAGERIFAVAGWGQQANKTVFTSASPPFHLFSPTVPGGVAIGMAWALITSTSGNYAPTCLSPVNALYDNILWATHL
jgi:hypothetical protein